MLGKYKGDSPGKAVTRFRMWKNMQSIAVLERIPYEGILVLAGEGGDISVLNTFPALEGRKIIAVDTNKEALDLVRKKFKNVVPVHGEIGEVSKLHNYNAAHLDFCGRLSVENIESTRKVINNMNGTGLLSVTMLKGREVKGGLKRRLWGNISRRERRDCLHFYRHKCKDRYEARIAEHLLCLRDGDIFDPTVVLDVSRERLINELSDCFGFDKKFGQSKEKRWGYTTKGKLGPLPSGLARIDALLSCCSIIGSMRGEPIPPVRVTSTFTYNSSTKKDRGTPFVTSVCIVDSKEFEKISLDEANEFYKFDVSDAKRSLEQLKLIVCNIPRTVPSSSIAEMFHIKTATVAAWRAHHTMGTYDNTSRPAISFHDMGDLSLEPIRVLHTDWGTMATYDRSKVITNIRERGVIKEEHLKQIFNIHQ